MKSLIPVAVVLSVAGCAHGTQQAATLDQAKAWVSGLSGALSAAAAVYTGPSAIQVQKAAADLQAAAVAFQMLGDVSTARSAALSIVALAQQLSPMVAPYLGPNAVYVPMGLAVVQAFIAALPVPSSASPMPPAQMAFAAIRQTNN